MACRKIKQNSSLRLRNMLVAVAVIASAMTVLFVLHAETENSSAELIDGGWCGPDACYYIYSDGTLQIDGSGSMYDYSDLTPAPWYDHRDDITKIIIGDGITKLGEWAFVDCKQVRELTMPISLDSVVSEDYSVFEKCYHIEKINFTRGQTGYGYDYYAYSGSGSWYQCTPWYESRDCLKEINFGYGIEHIGNDAFRELNITKVVLPDSITSLGRHCFFDCTELTDLTIPVNLNSFGDENYPAFQGCIAINSVTITRGNGVPFDYDLSEAKYFTPWNMNPDIAKTVVISDDILRLGKYMFYTCNIIDLTIPIGTDCAQGSPFLSIRSDSLEKVTLTKGTGRGPDYSDSTCRYNPWNGAPNLMTLVIKEGVTHIGNNAFRGCYADTLILPNSLYSLGEYSFKDSIITYLTIPISLNAVWIDGYPAFDCVKGIEKITFIPGTGYGKDYCAYDDVDNCWYKNTPWYLCRDTLKEIMFEDGIKHIGSDAFRELWIESVVIPDCVESLGCHAFYNCYYLTDITVPITLDCVASGAYPAFGECDIENVHFTAGADGIGFDYYNDYFPPWAKFVRTPTTHLTFDSGIVYIGHDTFFGYTFYGKDGIIEPTAENLSGNSFAGMDGDMWIVNSGTERATSDHSSSDTGPILKADIITDIRRL